MRFTIYQQITPTFHVDESQNHYYKEDYKSVYTEEIPETDPSTFKAKCEELFARFNNGNYPEDYKGHSMSVGDIIEFETTPDEHGCFGTYSYICCNAGFMNVMLYDSYKDVYPDEPFDEPYEC